MSALPSIPRYELQEEVGSGGMSVVYRAVDTTLGREVAVKVLHRHLAGREEERLRFRQEAQAVASLRHPNILEIHDYSGDQAGDAWIVSEFIHGPTLRGFAEETGFGLPEVGALVGHQVCAALAFAHSQGVIHRDVKPENVMVGADGVVKLTDFGIAKMLDHDARLTATGALLGSPAHMAPEILEGRPTDARTDVFGAGTLLFWLCTGSLPFEGASPAEVFRRIAAGTFEDPRAVDPRVSDGLAEIILKAMALDPEARFDDGQALLDALSAHLEGEGILPAQATLAHFFAGPAEFKAATRGELLRRWSEGIAQASRDRKSAEIVRLANQILAHRPDHPEALGALAQLRRRARRKKAWRAGGGLLLLLALAAPALWLGWPEAPAPSPGDPRQAAASSPARPGPGPLATAPPAESAAPVRPTEGLDPTPAPSPPPAAPAKTSAAPPQGRDLRPEPPARRALRVLVEPFGDIYLDGTLRGRDREVTLELPVGPHTLRVEREGFVPIEAEIALEAGEGPQVSRWRLTPRAARLTVSATARAMLSVDGRPSGVVDSAPFELPIPFILDSEGRFELPREVSLSLQAPGHRPAVREVALSPGEQRELHFELIPLPAPELIE